VSDLQAAAERLRRYQVGDNLAEHDPAPLTAEAMTAAGWVRRDGGYWHHPAFGERIYFVEWSGGWNLKIESGANLRTLGELRRLVGLLGGEG